MQVHSLNQYSVRKRTEELTLLLKSVYRQDLDAEVKDINSDHLVVA